MFRVIPVNSADDCLSSLKRFSFLTCPASDDCLRIFRIHSICHRSFQGSFLWLELRDGRSLTVCQQKRKSGGSPPGIPEHAVLIKMNTPGASLRDHIASIRVNRVLLEGVQAIFPKAVLPVKDMFLPGFHKAQKLLPLLIQNRRFCFYNGSSLKSNAVNGIAVCTGGIPVFFSVVYRNGRKIIGDGVNAPAVPFHCKEYRSHQGIALRRLPLHQHIRLSRRQAFQQMPPLRFSSRPLFGQIFLRPGIAAFFIQL